MKIQFERLLILLIFATSSFIGCFHNPVGPGNYKDPTKFTWTVDTIANPGSFQTIVSSIWATSTTTIYVAGGTSEGAGLIYTWDGKSWTRVPISIVDGGPIHGEIGLSSICGFSSDNIWAGGFRVVSYQQSTGTFVSSNLMIHWDGKVWSESPVSGSGITEVVGTAPNDVWATGNSGVLRYDGSSWKTSQLPIPPQGMQFVSIAEVAPNDVYTVGFVNDVTAPTDTGSYFLYHFNGDSWRVIDSVIITSSYVGPITFGTSLFAVKGTLYSSGENGVQVFTDGSWTTILNDTRIGSVGGNGLNNLFAIGSQAIAYWYDGKRWTQLNIPGNTGIGFSAIWTDGSETFIVGDDGHKSYIYHGK